MKKLFLEVDPNQVEIKKLLGKDFLELSMRTVSSANPNRNNSWFTKEAQEKALASYNDKPILAYFTNGDFVSHDGVWRNDPDTGMDFWDTLGTRGERPIGTIRGKDRKEVVYDEASGLYWTEITCVLWTQYSYRQVKRLIEDAKRAAKEGGPTKNISVEVDLIDYEVLPNGVTKINDYNLQGITILGSREGRKVEPGIEGAQLSVLDVISSGLYEQQRHALMQAYEALDTTLQHKEDNSMPTAEEGKQNQEQVANAVTNPDQQPQPTATTFEQNNDTQPETQPDPAQANPEEPKGPEAPEQNFEENPKTQTICDLAWLIESSSYSIKNYEDTIKHYEETDAPGKNMIINMLKRMKASAEAEVSDLGKILAVVSAEDFTEDPEREAFEAELIEHCNLPEVYKQLCEMTKECNTYKEKCEAYEKPCPECGENPCVCEQKKYEALKAEYEAVKAEHDKLVFDSFMEKANAAIEAAKNVVTEEEAKAILERCEKKEILDFEALDRELAIAAGKQALANKDAKAAYAAPIPTYDTPDLKTAEVSKDPFARMGYKRKK